MATFICIHGAWHGGWCFEALRPLLETRGHRLLAPTLPGMGGVDAPLASVTLEGWADFVAALVRRESTPVILCGHSRGGIVISSAAERCHERLRALVYISAFLLPAGQSLRGFQMEVPNPQFGAALSPAEGGAAMRFDAAAGPVLFYHRCAERVALEASARLVLEPARSLVTPLVLSEERFGAVPRHYIECADDRAILPLRQRAMQALLPCASVTTLDSDHSPFLSCPDELAAALNRIARDCGGSDELGKHGAPGRS